MGCKYSCNCGGFCPGCHNFEKETYYGEAEDVAARGRGFSSYEDEKNYYEKQQEIDHE